MRLDGAYQLARRGYAACKLDSPLYLKTAGRTHRSCCRPIGGAPPGTVERVFIVGSSLTLPVELTGSVGARAVQIATASMPTQKSEKSQSRRWSPNAGRVIATHLSVS